MQYKGKATLTLHVLTSLPRQMTVASNQNVDIEERDGRTVISVSLFDAGLKVDLIDVAVGEQTQRFKVDSITHLERQYVFHCFPASN